MRKNAASEGRKKIVAPQWRNCFAAPGRPLIFVPVTNRHTRNSDFYLHIHQKAAGQLPHAEVATLKPYYTMLSDNIVRQRAETPEIIRGLVQAFAYTII